VHSRRAGLKQTKQCRPAARVFEAPLKQPLRTLQVSQPSLLYAGDTTMQQEQIHDIARWGFAGGQGMLSATIAPSQPRPEMSMSTLPAAPTTDAPSLLVVDDEPELRGLLAEYFTRHGFSVRTADHAAHARELLAQTRPQLALLDVNMPGENGLSLARWLREAHPEVAIVVLTTAGEAIDRIVGLEMGADDYLPKPFELRELLARVRAVLRRSLAAPAAPAASPLNATATPTAAQPATDARHKVRFGDRLLDVDQRKLYSPDGSEIEITAAEFDLLALFARHPNRPLNRNQIMEQAHNRGWDVFDRSIDLRMMRLRRKIEGNPDKPEVLKTVRNVGYVFVPRA
jgi:two-component system phosphate regulon response regulator OmpR